MFSIFFIYVIIKIGDGMTILEIIDKKRLNKELTRDEIEFAINGYLDGSVKDYQMSSLLMAIVLNGMSDKETIDLTDIMINSGDTIDLSKVEEPMLYLGFNITYLDTPTKRIACRLIGASVLETTLRDFCNGADEQNPIAVLLNINGKECVEIYTGLSNKVIKSVSVSYIKSPNKVKYVGQEGNVDCDLPDYMHYSIVSGAANRYLLSLNTQPTNQNNIKNNN